MKSTLIEVIREKPCPRRENGSRDQAPHSAASAGRSGTRHQKQGLSQTGNVGPALVRPRCRAASLAAAGRRRPTPGRAGARLKADGDASRIMLLLTEKVAREVVEAVDANTEALKRLEGRIDSKADA